MEIDDNKTFNILLLDDEPLISFVLKAFLRNTEFRLEATEHAEEALALLKQKNFDVIISDIFMEPVDGFEFRRQVRAFNAYIPFIYLTSASNGFNNELFTQIMDDLFSYYLPKSAGTKLLLNKLRQVCHSFHLHEAMIAQETQMNRNLSLAALVQQAVLPPWAHKGNGCEYSCLYRPFKQISGDLFEYFPLSDHSALFIFGDISGHGTHAALAMMAVQTFLKQIVNEKSGNRPDIIAQDLNDFLCTHLSSIVYMCAKIIYFDFKNNFLRSLNAGIPSVLCIRQSTGEQLFINPEKRGSIPLGMVRGTKISKEDVVEFHFPDDAVFLVSSDGVIDLTKDAAGNEYPPSGFITKLLREQLLNSETGNGTIWSLPARLYEALANAGYRYQQDDCSILALRKEPRLRDREIVHLIPANNLHVDDCVQMAVREISACCHTESASVRLELLLSEFLTNIVEHGFQRD